MEKTCWVLTEKCHTGIRVDNLVALMLRAAVWAWWNFGVAFTLCCLPQPHLCTKGLFRVFEQMLMWTQEQCHFFICAYFCLNMIGVWSRAEVHQQEVSAAVPLPTQSGSGSHLHLRKPVLMFRILHLHCWAADRGGNASFMFIDVGGVPFWRFWSCEDDVLNLK